MSNDTNCILCGASDVASLDPQRDEINFCCPNCGKFTVSGTAYSSMVSFVTASEKLLLSGYIREMNDRYKKQVEINTDNCSGFLESPLIAHDPQEKLDKLLLWYYRKTEYLGKEVPLCLDNAICYACNKRELNYLYEIASEKKAYLSDLVKSSGDDYDKQNVHLTLDGYLYCSNLQKTSRSNSKKVFVAMWFDDKIDQAYENAIKPAIIQCGFDAFRVDRHEHNNDITDEIIAGIKESHFIIADLSGYRGGVYYEAGFAKGLGLPVILTCRKDWFDGDPTAGKKVHFDVNHLNIIVWDSEEELKTRIINRIKATIL